MSEEKTPKNTQNLSRRELRKLAMEQGKIRAESAEEAIRATGSIPIVGNIASEDALDKISNLSDAELEQHAREYEEIRASLNLPQVDSEGKPLTRREIRAAEQAEIERIMKERAAKRAEKPIVAPVTDKKESAETDKGAAASGQSDKKTAAAKANNEKSSKSDSKPLADAGADSVEATMPHSYSKDELLEGVPAELQSEAGTEDADKPAEKRSLRDIFMKKSKSKQQDVEAAAAEDDDAAEEKAEAHTAADEKETEKKAGKKQKDKAASDKKARNDDASSEKEYTFPSIAPIEEEDPVFDPASVQQPKKDGFDGLIAGAVKEENANANTSDATALILPEMPADAINNPLDSTGEVFVSKAVPLPRSVSETGGHADVLDALGIDYDDKQETAEATMPGHKPVSARDAVSAQDHNVPIVAPEKKENSKGPMAFMIAGGALLVAVGGLLVWGFSSGVFNG